MVEFNWLHITDLHVGMAESAHLWPNIEYKFYEDLEFLIKDQVGPLDAVLFTGDFVQRGDAREYGRVDELLQRLWQVFDRLKCEPLLLAVPGNHDLVRPAHEDVKNPNPALDTLMHLWADKDHIRNSFWNNPASPQRRVVDEAFGNYIDWYQNTSLPTPDLYKEGALPGDFSTTIEKDKIRFGVVGLNSTYLQLTGGNFQGHLELNPRQFNAVYGTQGPRWTDQHRVCLLLTHQPPDWLSDKGNSYLEENHDPPHRFALHLFGHMHDADYTTVAKGGATPRRRMQGCSLFGLETWAKGSERAHGYSIGQIKIENNGGELRIWPRRAMTQQDGSWKIDRDPTFSLPKGKESTDPEQVELLRQEEARGPQRNGSAQIKVSQILPGDEDEPTESPEAKPIVDPILLARLAALRKKLSRIPEWLQQDIRDLEGEEFAKKILQSAIHSAVQIRVGALDEIDKSIRDLQADDETAISEAWYKYSTINNESEDIFRECLELMGGLALRQKNLDDSICWLADRVIHECASEYIGGSLPSFTVLARQEAQNRTMARIVRLRFPEWTVWSLPFAAHEFGHVVIEEDTVILRPFVEAQASGWEKHHLYEIVADAFALCMIGPAYLCAAIELRFDPLSGSDKAQLADSKRADVLFTVLEWMNDQARNSNGEPLNPYGAVTERLKHEWQNVLRRAEHPASLSEEVHTPEEDQLRDTVLEWINDQASNGDEGLPNPYSDITERLKHEWQNVLRRAEHPASLSEEVHTPEGDQLRDLVLNVLGNLRGVFTEHGQYPPVGNNGFKIAQEWAEYWLEQMRRSRGTMRLLLPQTSPASTLRDVLNAAWLCRMDAEPDHIDLVDDAAYRLCERIIDQRGLATGYAVGATEVHTKQHRRRSLRLGREGKL